MIGLYVTVPIASFRRGAAREYWETLPLPSPSTVYGFLLSMVGEVDRTCHIGARCTAGVIGHPDESTVLRKLWRIKDKKLGLGNGSNVRPDYQELLTDVRLVIWLDSSEEVTESEGTLQQRVAASLTTDGRSRISRFGGLSLGESTHMVDEVLPIQRAPELADESVRMFLLDKSGNFTLPVWVDHVGSSGTRNALGRLIEVGFEPPDVSRLPKIQDSKVLMTK
ncbi:CRISPR-associated protein Cas5 [Novipirellula aureliae]|uniref:CRISPR-associated protein Cas5 n=1 Tax=Novipirellula aureliae TaxID=2527966 RepID=A0A5C6E4J6_9BACT|nr:type I-MYXAN CRISPR-associated protein Cas5/Cmx5/DevS [Novipirellula aureliae]TWU43852.1 CRISPR-associated protein Cas5 [Novipirellula aureliae]